VQSSAPKPLKVLSHITFSGDRLILVDLNEALPDTILITTDKSVNVELLDRGYFEAKVINNTQQNTSFKVMREGKTITEFNSTVTQSGCLIQFFNR
jgi:hypothetical protein